MNKKIVIILVAILVVLLAAIAVIEIIKPNENTGTDDIIVNSNGETGIVVDLETGSTVEDSSKTESNSSVSDKVLGNEIVGEQNMADSDKTTSGDKDSSNSKDEQSSTSSNPNQQTMDGFKPWQ
jgi:hypothetical protein